MVQRKNKRHSLNLDVPVVLVILHHRWRESQYSRDIHLKQAPLVATLNNLIFIQRYITVISTAVSQFAVFIQQFDTSKI